jgi:prepilin-type processing-associated H-X9-DG protein
MYAGGDEEACASWHATSEMLADKTELKQYARHLGGVNLGYLDGHASWNNSQALIAKYGDLTDRQGGWSPEMGVSSRPDVWGVNFDPGCGFGDINLY